MATITSTIGTAGRNYSTPQAWEDALPASAITAGNDYVGEVYKDSEFVAAAPLVIAGVATDLTHGIILRAGPGQSFRDNANVRINALRYSAANGVAIRGTGGYQIAVDIQVPNVTLDGLQIAHTNNGKGVYAATNAPANTTIRNCIIEAPGSFSQVVRCDGNNTVIHNTAIINTGAGTALQVAAGSGSKLNGVTVVKTGAAGATGGVQGNSTTEARNVVSANFTTCFSGFNAGNCSNNASTDATAPGANSLTGLTLANLFEAPGTDYRTKAGSALIDAGTAIGPAFDISGTTRPQGAGYDIGAWEVLAASGGISLSPRVGRMALTGYAPVVERTARQSVQPGPGTLVLSGYAPSLAQSAHRIASPAPASMVLRGHAPALGQSAHQAVAPVPAGLLLYGHAPAVSQSNAQLLRPSPAALALSGHTPQLAQTRHQLAQPTPGQLALTGYAPTVFQTAPRIVSPGGGALALAGHAPSVAQTLRIDARYARPLADIAVGTWAPSSGSTLAAMIAEPSADAADFIKATSPGACRVTLNPVVPPVAGTRQVVRYQAWSPTGDRLAVRLLMGSTVIASWSHEPAPLVETIFAQQLTVGQVAAISDWSALAFEFEAY